MRIIKSNKVGTVLREVICGDVFVCARSGRNKDKDGFYMRIDDNSGVCSRRSRSEVIAVNLETAQLRRFNGDEIVRVIEAELHTE